MVQTPLEHVNLTVSDPDATAAWMCDVFGWKIRWDGGSIHNGRTIHVGEEDSYLAVYNPGKTPGDPSETYFTRGGLNHVAVIVDDLDGLETRVKAAGFTTGNHGDYEPGKRFYFHDHDGIEYEVVSYAA